MSLSLSLLLAPQAYRLDPERPLGRESAGAGFLEAYLRFGGNRRHHVVVASRSHGDWFHQETCRHQYKPETVSLVLTTGELPRLKQAPLLYPVQGSMNGPGSACPGVKVSFRWWASFTHYVAGPCNGGSASSARHQLALGCTHMHPLPPARWWKVF